jgi:hypothetical protein
MFKAIKMITSVTNVPLLKSHFSLDTLVPITSQAPHERPCIQDCIQQSRLMTGLMHSTETIETAKCPVVAEVVKQSMDSDLC